MKARIVLAGLLVSMVVVEVSAQRAEYDDMYFRGKDREKNKAIEVEEALYASAKTTKEKQEEVVVEEDNTNPTDSYSARNVNPEYVSRSNSEKASEDESNYYLEGYVPPASTNSNFNNSYYNNVNAPGNSYYANNNYMNSPYYGSCGCGSSPYYGGGYNPWMSPAYGYGTGWAVSLTYGNYYNPYGGYGYGSPYYGGYPGYYGGNNGYNESPRVVNYGKRPSRHSAVVQPTARTNRDNPSANTTGNNTTASNGRTRVRQTQDEYYIRPARRTSTLGLDNSVSSNSSQRNSGSGNSLFQPSTSQPARARESSSYSPPTRTPSYTPSSSPSRGSSGSSGGGGSSSPRPRGRN